MYKVIHKHEIHFKELARRKQTAQWYKMVHITANAYSWQKSKMAATSPHILANL